MTNNRANRVTINSTETGFMATFWRTHKNLGTYTQYELGYESDGNKTTLANREDFRKWATENSDAVEISFQTDAKQAWNRKYAKYATDQQVMEDAKTLTTMAIQAVVDKMEDIVLIDIDPTGVSPVSTKFEYIEDGKYLKDGSWAYCEIQVDVILASGGNQITVPMDIQMVSGQIKKLHITQGSLRASINDEMELMTA